MNIVNNYNAPPKADDSDSSSIYQGESNDSEEIEVNEHALYYQSLKSKENQEKIIHLFKRIEW